MKTLIFIEVVGAIGVTVLAWFIYRRWHPRRFDRILLQWHESHAIYLSLFQFLWNLLVVCFYSFVSILTYRPELMPAPISFLLSFSQKNVIIAIFLFMYIFNVVLFASYSFFRVYVTEQGILFIRWQRFYPMFYLILWEQIRDYSIQLKEETLFHYILTLKDLRRNSLFHFHLDVPYLHAADFQKLLTHKLNENKWIQEERKRLFQDLSLN